MADEILFSGKELVDLSRDIKLAAAALAREGAPVLMAIGQDIEQRAKRIVGDYSWQTGKRRSVTSDGGNTTQQVIDSINGRLDGAYTYRIRAGEGVPLAGLWELGNRGSRASATTFSHPLFGNRRYSYSQPKHPFLRRALAEDRAGITRQLNAVWDRVLTPYRLRPSTLVSAIDVSQTVTPTSGNMTMSEAATVAAGMGG